MISIRFKKTVSALSVLFFLLFFQNLYAQITFPEPAVKDSRKHVYAFENARIFKDYKTELTNATLVIRDGKIEACGSGVSIPKDAVRVDCAGKTIYPAFIDLYAADFGLPEAKSVGKKPKQQPQRFTNKEGPYSWNEALKTEYKAAEAYKYNEKAAKAYRKAGFSTLLTHQADGISRGLGALLAPIDERSHKTLIEDELGHFLSFRKGKSTQNYPNSLMGIIALLRQTYLDADWYARVGKNQETNLSLEAWIAVQSQAQIFQSEDVFDALRIGQLAKEFNKKYIIKSAGDDYQRIEAVRALNMPLILPLDFPESYAVKDPYDAQRVSLGKLKHWELATGNAAAVAQAGIPFTFTAHGLEKKSMFLKQIRAAIEAGLTTEAALRALTHTPAELIGQQSRLGSLDAGKIANFLITDGAIFNKKTKLLENWSMGEQLVIKDDAAILTEGQTGIYNLLLDGDMMLKMELSQKDGKAKATILKGEEKIKTETAVDMPHITLAFALNKTSTYQLSGTIEGAEIKGRGTDNGGRWIDWSATRKGNLAEGEKKKKEEKEAEVKEKGAVFYPFVAYGWNEKPKSETVVVRNATVWTNEKEGILEEADVLFSKGKIVKIGQKLNVPEIAIEIDGTGKHLTAGIIDEHSHIAITRGVNEGTQESTAEVRIGDVLNPEDINIYRQLAGGVTSSHLLHGSANPIGGQTQLIKMRWGSTPEEMKFKNWDGFIKFALGENVKQSNWGDNNRSRFPQTRMGVEQTFVDYFTRAKEYGVLKKSGKTYRRDLELDCLQEIIESKRFITCHSYVQSEINMLMKVADQFDFTLNTFTHILEGYKVADKMVEHGAGGSTFSDWWAYKFEVYQAIPYNAAIMHEQGVTVAINSDDREMARRLNQEAAKSVKYGGMSEEDAWKMVTLNPAKLLHVDDRVGSLKAGKHADIVLWSDNPLSIYAKVEHTWVDGIRYYDKAKDIEMRTKVQQERARIITKMLNLGKGNSSKNDKTDEETPHYHCDTIHDEG